MRRCEACRIYACVDTANGNGRFVNKVNSSAWGAQSIGIRDRIIVNCPVLYAINKGVKPKEAAKLLEEK